MKTSDMQQLLFEQLSAILNLDRFEFFDDSHLHIGHAGNTGGGHYRVFLVSEDFNGRSRIARHRLVQEPLKDLFSQGRIHALGICALTPAEYRQSTA